MQRDLHTLNKKLIEVGLFTLIFLLSIEGYTALPSDSHTKCNDEIESTLSKLKSSDDWTQIIELSKNSKRFRSPTEEFGSWVEIILGENPEIYLISASTIKDYKFSPKDCSKKSSREYKNNSIESTPSESSFTDSNLKELLDKKETALIYVFSPVMSYSLHFLVPFSKVASKLKINFIPLLPPKEGILPFKNDTEFKFIPKIANSVELEMRQMFTHFPSSLVISKGKILDPFIFGVMPSDTLEDQIKARLKSLEKEK